MIDPKNASTSSKGSGEVEPARCGAKKRDGTPCRKFPMLGGRRCRLHGGASPQAVAKARERILGAADLAAQRLIEFMNDKRVPWPVRLSAARDLLDRAGLNAKTEVSIEVQPWAEIIEKIIVDDPRGELPEPRQLPPATWQAETWQEEETAYEACEEEAELPEAEPEVLPADATPATPPPTPVEPASFDSKPPARLDPDGLARTAAPRRRNREP